LVRASGGLGGARRSLGRKERRHLLARVGFARVALDPVTREVRLEPGTRLDLGGVAKGYAADLALAALRQAGATFGLVDLGRSSQGAFGCNLTVDVADPQQTGAPAWATFELGPAALASSGGDQRPGHILDPHSGLPARRLLATTVLAATGAEADALSTALFVLGQERGLALLRRRGAEGLVLWRDTRGQRRMRTTPGFAARHGLATRADVEVHE
jgi:thiamine biosynthesis lipoprotein